MNAEQWEDSERVNNCVTSGTDQDSGDLHSDDLHSRYMISLILLFNHVKLSRVHEFSRKLHNHAGLRSQARAGLCRDIVKIYLQSCSKEITSKGKKGIPVLGTPTTYHQKPIGRLWAPTGVAFPQTL